MSDRFKQRTGVNSRHRQKRGPSSLALVIAGLALAGIPLGYFGHQLWPYLHRGPRQVDPVESPARDGDPSPAVPTSSSRVARLVDDEAAVLDPSQTQQLTQLHTTLLSRHDVDLRVVTVKAAQPLLDGPEPLEAVAQARYEDMRTGSLSQGNMGAVLLVDAQYRLARLKAAPVLEKLLSKPFVSYVETELLLPFFQSDRLAQGLLVATRQVAQRIEDAVAKRAFVRPDTEEGRALVTNGAPASGFNFGNRREPTVAVRVSPSASSPTATFQRYLEALAAGDGRPDLMIYTAESRAFLEAHAPSPEQLAAVVETYRVCPAPQVKRQGNLAVLRFPKPQRRCAPYFLRRERGAWKLDLAAMGRAVQYNHQGQWHFVRNVEHPYQFAFRDWHFDYYGFPR